MLSRIVSACGVLGYRDGFGQPDRSVWLEVELLEREHLRTRLAVCLDEMHAKLDQQPLRRGTFVPEVNNERDRVADRGYGRCNVNVTHSDAGGRKEAENFERLWLSSLHS